MEGLKRIGIFTPASSPDKELFQKGLSTLKNLGFSVKNFALLEGATPFERAYLFKELFECGEFDVLWAARGGFGSIELVLNLETLGIGKVNEPPLIVGFSDVTVLHSYMFKRLGIQGLHAPVVTTVPFTSPSALYLLKEVLLRKKRDLVLKGKPYVYGEAEGMLVVGNLSCLSSLCGTEFFPKEPCILLLEEVNEPTYKIKRKLYQLILYLKDKIKGIAFGNLGIEKVFSLISDVVSLFELTCPVAFGFSVGHFSQNFPVFFGQKTNLVVTHFKARLEQEF